MPLYKYPSAIELFTLCLTPKRVSEALGKVLRTTGEGSGTWLMLEAQHSFLCRAGGAVVRLRWGNISENVSQTGTLPAGGS